MVLLFGDDVFWKARSFARTMKMLLTTKARYQRTTRE
jgi:hypothetical protein